MPALDGLRGVAVAAVVAYHLGAGWLPGGYLGVDVFFVLSGFLITSLLLAPSPGGLARLGAFWGRRARRLLPALLVLLAVLALAQAAGLLATTASVLRGDALATLAYVANWHQLVAGQSYFARFSAPSPLQHTWSLGIEEQFYVLWPLLLAMLLRGRGRGRRVAPVVTAAAACLSAGWATWLALHGASLDRLYYGTDTRAFELLAGALVALVVARRPEPGPGARRLLHAGGLAGAAALAWLLATASPSARIFEGTLVVAVLAVAAVLADTRLERPGPLAGLLGAGPLRLLGRISYAVYLWHWPVVVELSPTRTGVAGAGLQVLRLAVTGLLAAASTFLVEEPLRRRRLGAWPRLARLGLAPLAVAAVGGLVVVTTVPPAAAAPGPALAADATAVPGAGGLVGEPPLSVPLAGTPATPLRVTLVGDSVMRDQGPALGAALGATGAVTVTDMSFPGWGLRNDKDWEHGVPAMLAATRPDVVLASWSWDDDWLLADPSGYRAVLDRFLGLLLAPPGGVRGPRAIVLEQFPPLEPLPSAAGGPAGRLQRVRGVEAWNALAASLPARYPGRVLYFPVAAAVERAGRYSTWLPPPGTPSAPAVSWVRVRAVDATHLCPAGAARYAAAVVSDLETVLRLPPPTAGWWNGSWSRDPAYDASGGICPDDHPRP